MAKPNKTTGIAFEDASPEVSPEVTAPAPVAPATPNVMTFADYEAEAFTFGQTKGAGDESYVSLGIKICEGAKAGVIKPHTVKEQKNAKDAVDHIKILWEKFLNGRAGKIVHDRSDNDNKTTQFRAYARLGANPDIDGPAVLDTIMAVYKAIPDAEKKTLKDAFNAYTSAVTFQNDKDHRKVALTEDEIKPRLVNSTKANPDVVSAWKAIEKLTTALVKGTRGDKVEDKSPEAEAIALTVKTYYEKLVAADKAEKARLSLVTLSDDELDAQEAALAAARAARKAASETTLEAAE